MSKLPRPFQKWTTYDGHVGIDYPYANNTIVPASGNGVVTFSGYFSDRGGYGVSVQYDNGQLQSYKHSDKEDWRIPKGSKVAIGNGIMQIGKLGVGSTGYHLHHEVFINGVIQTGENYWKYVDKSSNGYVGAPSTAGGKDDENPKLEEVTLKMHEALIVNKESNKLLIVNLKDKTLIDLGNDPKSGLRAYYANNFPWHVVGEPEWTTRFKGYTYI